MIDLLFALGMGLLFGAGLVIGAVVAALALGYWLAA